MNIRIWPAITLVMLLYLVFTGNFGRDFEAWPWILTVCALVMLLLTSPRNKASVKDRVVAVMGLVILGFCFYGFGSKFIELVRLVVSDSEAAQEGVFAVAPLMNYLLASAGFLCLLGWAAIHGMFRDIEQPKQTMLEVNAQLDAEMKDLKYCSSVMGKEATLQ